MTTRPSGISAIGILTMLSAAWLLFLGGMYMTRAVNSYLEIKGDVASEGAAEFLIMKVVMAATGSLVSVGLGFALLAIGRGLWSFKYWAYRMTQGLAILAASFSAVVGVLAVMDSQWTDALVQLPAATMAGWAIWYLNSKSVAELFSKPAAQATPASTPPSNPVEP